MSKEEQNAIAAQLAAGCKDTEGASDDDVAAMMAREHPTTKPGKCLIACIMETIGVVSTISNIEYCRRQNDTNFILNFRLRMVNLL